MPIEFSDVKGKIVLPAKKKETRKGFMMSAVIDFGTPRNPDHWYINFYPQDGAGFGEAEELCLAQAGETVLLSGKVRKYQRGDGYNVVADVDYAEVVESPDLEQTVTW